MSPHQRGLPPVHDDTSHDCSNDAGQRLPNLSDTGLCGCRPGVQKSVHAAATQTRGAGLDGGGEKRLLPLTSSAPTVQIVRRMALLMGKERHLGNRRQPKDEGNHQGGSIRHLRHEAAC